MKLRIFSVLKGYAKSKSLRLHMPGHKGKGVFRDMRYDITELSFSDNLDDPKGVIADAEKDIAGILGSQKSFILTDGSTSGIYTMLKSVADEGNSIIVSRYSHKSVFNACRIFNIEPIVLENRVKEGLPSLPGLYEIEEILKERENVIGVLATYPDYFGRFCDLKGIKGLTERYGKRLLVDGAHGAHLRFFGNYAGEYADIWVDGVHKTLPAMTQGAVLNVGNEELIEKVQDSIGFFRTSSPGYPVMASVEYAIKAADSLTKRAKEEFNKVVFEFKKNCGYKALENDDVLKFVIDCMGGAKALAAHLNGKGVWHETEDGRYLVLILSPFSYKQELKRLQKALKGFIFPETTADGGDAGPVKALGILDALKRDMRKTPLEESAGKVSGVFAGSFPPCYPLILPGEVITEAIIARLKTGAAYGIRNGYIFTVE